MGTPRPSDTTESTDDVVGTLCIDGQPLTEADVERIHADRAVRVEQIRRAVIAVAAFAHDGAECSEFLAMLGFETDIVSAVRDELHRQHGRQAAPVS